MNTKETYKSIKSKQSKASTKKFKDQYFEYYDDIKSHTHNVYDWQAIIILQNKKSQDNPYPNFFLL